MSYDLFIFEKISSFKTSIDVKSYLKDFLKYDKDLDYQSLDNCSPKIGDFAKEMFKNFHL